MRLLSKGLSFVPSVNFDIFNNILDVNKFTRSLTIKRHFKTCPYQDTMNPNNQISASTREDLSHLLFTDQCTTLDLQDLMDTYPPKFIQTIDTNYSNPDYYPKNTHIPYT